MNFFNEFKRWLKKIITLFDIDLCKVCISEIFVCNQTNVPDNKFQRLQLCLTIEFN